VDDVWATKSEHDVRLIARAVSFQDFESVVLIHKRHSHRRTDGQTDIMQCQYRAMLTKVHRAVKNEKGGARKNDRLLD